MRIPVTFTLNNREASLQKDSKMVNAYKEGTYVLKRPGLTQLASTLPLDTGYGIASYLGNLYTVVGETFYKVTESGTTTTVGSVINTLSKVYFTPTFNNNYLFFHNGTNGYLHSSAGVFQQLTNDVISSITINTEGGGYLNPSLFSPTKKYVLYETIYYGSNVYMVITAGTSGVTPPTFTSGTATNGSMTIAYIGTLTSIAPVVTIDAPVSGTQAAGTASISDGGVTGITLTNKGSGYTTTPSIEIGTEWAPSTALVRGQQVFYGGNNYTVVNASGTTSATTGPTHTSGTAANGTVTLLYQGSIATATATLNAFPTDLVPGVAYLDTYVVVLTKEGRLYSCDVEDPTSWGALNYVNSNSKPDEGTGIVGHLNYIVAFNQYSTQFFYDAANPTGSPFNVNPSYNIEVGCPNGDSIVKFDVSVAWVGESIHSGKGVYALSGMTPAKISTEYVDKFLDFDGVSNCSACGLKINGHTWYVLTLPDSDVTLVYDFDEKEWYVWSSVVEGIEQYFVGSFSTQIGNTKYVQSSQDGIISIISPETFTDYSGSIYFRLVSPLLDGDTKYRKYISRVEIVGDINDYNINVRHTDDDYTTWSDYRQIYMGNIRTRINNCGTTRRRAYELFSSDNKRIRISNVEMDVTQGVS